MVSVLGELAMRLEPERSPDQLSNLSTLNRDQCPQCHRKSIYHRNRKTPTWRCRSCGTEWDGWNASKQTTPISPRSGLLGLYCQCFFCYEAAKNTPAGTTQKPPSGKSIPPMPPQESLREDPEDTPQLNNGRNKGDLFRADNRVYLPTTKRVHQCGGPPKCSICQSIATASPFR
jgi:hypothetical protein